MIRGAPKLRVGVRIQLNIRRRIKVGEIRKWSGEGPGRVCKRGRVRTGIFLLKEGGEVLPGIGEENAPVGCGVFCNGGHRMEENHRTNNHNEERITDSRVVTTRGI